MVVFLSVILLTWNLLVFLLYGVDKRKALKNEWRISEKTLLFLALFFGAIGALIGGNLFHHKTQKWYFQVAWYLGTIFLLLFVYYLYSTLLKLS